MDQLHILYIRYAFTAYIVLCILYAEVPLPYIQLCEQTVSIYQCVTHIIVVHIYHQHTCTWHSALLTLSLKQGTHFTWCTCSLQTGKGTLADANATQYTCPRWEKRSCVWSPMHVRIAGRPMLENQTDHWRSDLENTNKQWKRATGGIGKEWNCSTCLQGPSWD